jgi:hypothetical protein
MRGTERWEMRENSKKNGIPFILFSIGKHLCLTCGPFLLFPIITGLYTIMKLN